MYAIIQTGGHQYRVTVGDQLDVEKLPVEPGTEITLDQVLLVGDDNDQVTVGTQRLADGLSSGEDFCLGSIGLDEPSDSVRA